MPLESSDATKENIIYLEPVWESVSHIISRHAFARKDKKLNLHFSSFLGEISALDGEIEKLPLELKAYAGKCIVPFEISDPKLVIRSVVTSDFESNLIDPENLPDIEAYTLKIKKWLQVLDRDVSWPLWLIADFGNFLREDILKNMGKKQPLPEDVIGRDYQEIWKEEFDYENILEVFLDPYSEGGVDVSDFLKIPENPQETEIIKKIMRASLASARVKFCLFDVLDPPIKSLKTSN